MEFIEAPSYRARKPSDESRCAAPRRSAEGALAIDAAVPYLERALPAHESPAVVDTASPRILPPCAAQHSVRWTADAVLNPQPYFLGIPLPRALGSAVAERRLSFLAGRYCARQAMRRCRPASAETIIAVGKGQAPVWPDGVVGSITHDGQFVSAAVASRDEAAALGIDTESLLTREAADEILPSVARPEELQVVEKAGLERAVALTLIFSAKESLFKCLYPSVGRYFDYLDVAVVAVQLPEHRAELELLAPLKPSLSPGRRFGASFEIGDDHVHTGCFVPANDTL
jgi:enterobactin synthetase component D